MSKIKIVKFKMKSKNLIRTKEGGRDFNQKLLKRVYNRKRR